MYTHKMTTDRPVFGPAFNLGWNSDNFKCHEFVKSNGHGQLSLWKQWDGLVLLFAWLIYRGGESIKVAVIWGMRDGSARVWRWWRERATSSSSSTIGWCFSMRSIIREGLYLKGGTHLRIPFSARSYRHTLLLHLMADSRYKWPEFSHLERSAVGLFHCPFTKWSLNGCANNPISWDMSSRWPPDLARSQPGGIWWYLSICDKPCLVDFVRSDMDGHSGPSLTWVWKHASTWPIDVSDQLKQSIWNQLMKVTGYCYWKVSAGDDISSGGSAMQKTRISLEDKRQDLLKAGPPFPSTRRLLFPKQPRVRLIQTVSSQYLCAGRWINISHFFANCDRKWIGQHDQFATAVNHWLSIIRIIPGWDQYCG